MVATSLALNASSVSLAWRKYNVSLRQSPVATKAVTCMAAYAVGDLSAQISSRKGYALPERLAAVDLIRTGRMALYGLLWCGPACHSFYARLDRMFAAQAPAAAATIAGKVAADQLLFAPLCSAVFFAWTNLASGTAANIPADLSTKLPASVKAAWALWVPAMTINMALVPPPLRILFINATAIVWTNILSGMAGDAAPKAPATMPADVDFEADVARTSPAALAAISRRSTRRVSSAERTTVASERPLPNVVPQEEELVQHTTMHALFNTTAGSRLSLVDDDISPDFAMDEFDALPADATSELLMI